MSTVQPKKRGKAASGNFSRTIQVFDANFDQKDVVVKGSIELAKNLTEAHNLVGNDEDQIVAAINSYAKTKALAAEVRKATQNGEVSARSVMKFLRPFRLMEEFKEMSEKDQTAALLSKVKENAFLLAGLKAQAAADAESDDEDEE